MHFIIRSSGDTHRVISVHDDIASILEVSVLHSDHLARKIYTEHKYLKYLVDFDHKYQIPTFIILVDSEFMDGNNEIDEDIIKIIKIYLRNETIDSL